MNRKQKIIVSVTGIFLVLLILLGLTYAYFLTQITGNTNPTSISVTTANLALKYDDGNGMLTSDTKLVPDTIVSEKTFSVENTGNATIDAYAVTLEDLMVTYANTVGTQSEGALTYLQYPETMELIITCKEYEKTSGNFNPETAETIRICNGYNASMPTTNDILLTNKIETGKIHVYSLSLKYLNAEYDQSLDMNKKIQAKIDIIDTKGTFDIEGVISQYSTGDYVQVNSQPKKAFLNKDGRYKIVGLEPDEHTVSLYNISNTNTPKYATDIEVQLGDSASVNGSLVTVSNLQRRVTFNQNSRSGTYAISKVINKLVGNGASLVNVGDYVNYNYTGSEYITPTVSSGYSVYGETQTFSSASGEALHVEPKYWRVIGVEDGQVKLIPNDLKGVSGKLKLSGANGYLNSERVLNELCDTLYSSVNGTARSIKMSDIDNEIEYDGTVYYRNADGFVEVEPGTTVGNLETSLGLSILGSRLTPDGSDIRNIPINHYQYRLLYHADDAPLTRDIVRNHFGLLSQSKNELSSSNMFYRLFAYRADQSAADGDYWIVGNTNDVYFYEGDSEGDYFIKYRQRFLGGTGPSIGGKTLYSSNGVSEEAEYKVMPIITLNKDIQLEKSSTVADLAGTMVRYVIK